MSTQMTLPSIQQLAAKLEKPLHEVERRAAQNQLAVEYAEERGGGLQDAINKMSDLMYFGDNSGVQYNAAKFLIKEVHGIGKEDGNTGPQIVINMNGDNTKAAIGILNPNRNQESELPE